MVSNTWTLQPCDKRHPLIRRRHVTAAAAHFSRPALRTPAPALRERMLQGRACTLLRNKLTRVYNTSPYTIICYNLSAFHKNNNTLYICYIIEVHYYHIHPTVFGMSPKYLLAQSLCQTSARLKYLNAGCDQLLFIVLNRTCAKLCGYDYDVAMTRHRQHLYYLKPPTPEFDLISTCADRETEALITL